MGSEYLKMSHLCKNKEDVIRQDKDEQSSAPLCVQHQMCPFVLFLVRSRNSKCGLYKGLIIKEQHVGLRPNLLLQ